jgi:predicted enzyme related to lactoylglutathione lyase
VGRETIANKHGEFIWYELLTPDAEAAQAFYAGIFGWSVTDSGQQNMDYRIPGAAQGEIGVGNRGKPGTDHRSRPRNCLVSAETRSEDNQPRNRGRSLWYPCAIAAGLTD